MQETQCVCVTDNASGTENIPTATHNCRSAYLLPYADNNPEDALPILPKKYAIKV